MNDWVQVASFRKSPILLSLFGVSNIDTSCNCLLVMVFAIAALLLCSALSVDVTSQSPRSYLELRESLDASEAFLE